MSSESCDVASDGADDAGNITDSSPEGSGGFTVASTSTMNAALAVFVFFMMGLLW